MKKNTNSSKRKPLFGNNRSHSLNATKRKFNLNVKKIKIKENNNTKTIKLTTREFRTLKKNNKI